MPLQRHGGVLQRDSSGRLLRGCPGCPGNSYCNSSCPASYTFTISGISGDACCTAINGAYIIPLLSPCYWYKWFMFMTGPLSWGWGTFSVRCVTVAGVTKWKAEIEVNAFTGACAGSMYRYGTYVGYIKACRNCPAGTYSMSGTLTPKNCSGFTLVIS